MNTVNGLPLLTEQDLGDLPVKRCSHSTAIVPRAGKLTRELGTLPVDDADKTEARRLVEVIMNADYTTTERICHQFANQVERFTAVRNAVAAILPVVSEGRVEVLATVPYRMPLPNGRTVDVINLTLSNPGSTFAVGIPNHAMVPSESFQAVVFNDGSMMFELDKVYEPRALMRQIARGTSMKAVMPPPMFASH